MRECRYKDRILVPCCMGYPTECRQISAKWRLASKWAIMSRTVPKGVDAPWLCARIANKAFRLRARANRVQWWPQRGRELQAIAARQKRMPSSIKLRGGRGAAVGSIHQKKRVTVGDGYFLTFSIQHFYFFLYEKSWYLTVTNCHHTLSLMGNAAAQQHCAALVRSLSKQACISYI